MIAFKLPLRQLFPSRNRFASHARVAV